MIGFLIEWNILTKVENKWSKNNLDEILKRSTCLLSAAPEHNYENIYWIDFKFH